MRLINARTCRLEDVPSPILTGSSNVAGQSLPQTPEYAILSHTWGSPEEEVSLQDMLQHPFTAHNKIGFHKIKLSCGQALRDGLSYVWVDTCCIDKSSSAELSEAINSMFAWYRLSKVCYVYLADVTRVSFNGADNFQLRRSRWFTRGWTLQELIAPIDVRFYSAQWVPLGSRNELCATIEEVTKIDASYLTGETSVESASVAQRMAWASSRETTRVEDMAYCLLGIFGVNIPLIYGEGVKSFIRLQEEIIRKSEDQSIFVWEPPSRGREVKLGPLAESPSWFRDSSNVIPCDLGDAWDPPAVTSRGIHIQAALFNSGTADLAGFIILKCRYRNNMFDVLALPVLPAEHKKAQYVRHPSEAIIGVNGPRWQFLVQQEHPEKIYLTDPYSIHKAELDRRRHGFLVRLPEEFVITTVQPAASWLQNEGFFNTNGGTLESPIFAVICSAASGNSVAILCLRLVFGWAEADEDQPLFMNRRTTADCALTPLPYFGRIELTGDETWYHSMHWGSGEVSVSAEEQVVFGTPMFVVDVGWDAGTMSAKLLDFQNTLAGRLGEPAVATDSTDDHMPHPHPHRPRST